MIFQHTWEKVLSGEKTQTRRLAKSDEMLFSEFFATTPKRDSVGRTHVRDLCGIQIPTFDEKWSVGHTYAVQPARNQKSVGRIRITAIRREDVQSITYEDARAEGAPPDHLCDCYSPVRWYANLWDAINRRKGIRWNDNPTVWVLTFELVRE